MSNDTQPSAKKFSPACAVGSTIVATVIYFTVFVCFSIIMMIFGPEHPPRWFPRMPIWVGYICWGYSIFWIATRLYPTCRRRYG